jgi:hypothetical protein
MMVADLMRFSIDVSLLCAEPNGFIFSNPLGANVFHSVAIDMTHVETTTGLCATSVM